MAGMPQFLFINPINILASYYWRKMASFETHLWRKHYRKEWTEFPSWNTKLSPDIILKGFFSENILSGHRPLSLQSNTVFPLVKLIVCTKPSQLQHPLCKNTFTFSCFLLLRSYVVENSSILGTPPDSAMSCLSHQPNKIKQGLELKKQVRFFYPCLTCWHSWYFKSTISWSSVKRDVVVGNDITPELTSF